MLRVAFDRLQTADLHVDACYCGGNAGNVSDDPISVLIPGVGNQGGFRICGSADVSDCPYAVLYSSGEDPDWPDHLDEVMGQFTYYGDNKKPGRELHQTPKGGNLLLRNAFASLHSGTRSKIPAFLIFTKAGSGRDVIFRGLAVPGVDGLSETEDLVAIWRSDRGQRFQNYRATFTILDVPVVPQNWLESLRTCDDRNESSVSPPKNWSRWQKSGVNTPLRAERSRQVRTKSEQLPKDPVAQQIVKAIHDHFKEQPHSFEHFAARVFQLSDSNVVSCEVTRRWRDGGRDAVGTYRIGQADNGINVEFALEAKCYSVTNSVGVRETSRLISRLLHRQFGVLVSTSYLHKQAYSEIKEDGHPVIVFSAIDIVNVLQARGFRDKKSVQQWLEQQFPRD